jgi:NAD-reducing hydrogenase small subunit
MRKARIATTWLDGCSGCHMSLLDIDERLVDIADKIELVYGPLVDVVDFPESVDIALVEGAVSNEEDVKNICLVRERSKILVSFGDCAVTSNVPAMRNEFSVEDVLKRSYKENVSYSPQVPQNQVPRLLPHVRPVHEYVHVDIFLPGCPPPAEAIFFLFSELLKGNIPDLSGKTRFGA